MAKAPNTYAASKRIETPSHRTPNKPGPESPNTYAASKRIETNLWIGKSKYRDRPPIPTPRPSGLKHTYLQAIDIRLRTPNTYAASKRIETWVITLRPNELRAPNTYAASKRIETRYGMQPHWDWCGPPIPTPRPSGLKQRLKERFS